MIVRKLNQSVLEAIYEKPKDKEEKRREREREREGREGDLIKGVGR